jgi:hypothetical protein
VHLAEFLVESVGEKLQALEERDREKYKMNIKFPQS